MGAELWLLMASPKQAEAVKAFLAPLRPADSTDAYAFADVGDDDGWCFLRWTSALKLEVGYQFGQDTNRACASMVGREIAKRFEIRKTGADSVGWFKKGAVERLKNWTFETLATLLYYRTIAPEDPWVANLQEQLGRVNSNITTLFEELDSHQET